MLVHIWRSPTSAESFCEQFYVDICTYVRLHALAGTYVGLPSDPVAPQSHESQLIGAHELKYSVGAVISFVCNWTCSSQ